MEFDPDKDFFEELGKKLAKPAFYFFITTLIVLVILLVHIYQRDAN